ncbi:hypothetical protein NQZ68_017027 [Dissostichus eleginoides]|nr:hypothetical protein NQZ68_017027 [Dissostichus eleginoides]
MSAGSSSSLPESELCFLASVQTKAWRLWRASCPGLTPASLFPPGQIFPRCLALAVPGSACRGPPSTGNRGRKRSSVCEHKHCRSHGASNRHSDCVRVIRFTFIKHRA